MSAGSHRRIIGHIQDHLLTNPYVDLLHARTGLAANDGDVDGTAPDDPSQTATSGGNFKGTCTWGDDYESCQGPAKPRVGLVTRRAEIAAQCVDCSKLAVCLGRFLGLCPPATQIV
jgi:hypothetical protein